MLAIAFISFFDLYLVFLSEQKQDPRFNFVDISSLTVFSDNVLPAVLRGLGIIEVNEELAKQIDNNEKITNRKNIFH